MSMNVKFVDDGYDGFVLNPDTGQVLRTNKTLNSNPFYIRVDGPNYVAKVRASKPVPTKNILRENLEGPPKAEPVVEATPEAEDKVDEDSGELALVTIEAQVSGSEDKGRLKEVGATLGLSLSKAMNVDTMQERIATQIAEIRAASKGA